jgi:hypothetical protein
LIFIRKLCDQSNGKNLVAPWKHISNRSDKLYLVVTIGFVLHL